MNKILLIPLVAGAIAQLLKIFFNKHENYNIKSILVAYSGMPSAHSAIVVSLATITGLEDYTSPIFAISIIFAFMTIRDALGIRQYLGQHGKMLNELVRDLGNDNVLDQKYPHLLENIGHTPLQVFVGSMIGFLVSLAGFYIL
jgi:acid phosphatase family membrane protein YuiD